MNRRIWLLATALALPHAASAQSMGYGPNGQVPLANLPVIPAGQVSGLQAPATAPFGTTAGTVPDAAAIGAAVAAAASTANAALPTASTGPLATQPGATPAAAITAAGGALATAVTAEATTARAAEGAAQTTANAAATATALASEAATARAAEALRLPIANPTATGTFTAPAINVTGAGGLTGDAGAATAGGVALSAVGATANAALPKAGGTVTGATTFTALPTARMNLGPTGVTAAYPTTGISLGWNLTAGSGEGDLLLGQGGGSLGGLNIYQLNASTGVPVGGAPILALSAAGTMTLPGIVATGGTLPATAHAPIYVTNNLAPSAVTGFSMGEQIIIGTGVGFTPSPGDNTIVNWSISNENGRGNLWGADITVLQSPTGTNGMIRAMELEVGATMTANTDPFSGAPRQNGLEIVATGPTTVHPTAAATVWANGTAGTNWWYTGLALSRVYDTGIRFVQNPGGTTDAINAFQGAAISDESNSARVLRVSGSHLTFLDASAASIGTFIKGSTTTATNLAVVNSADFSATWAVSSGLTTVQQSKFVLQDRGADKWWLLKNFDQSFGIYNFASTHTVFQILPNDDLVLANLPTTCSGHASKVIWNNAGVLNVCP